jgi:hypothetical protein
LDEADQRATAAYDALVAARGKLDELTARHGEATADLARAEEALRASSAGLVSPGGPEAVEAFHAATRHRAEMEARVKAFNEVVMPKALAVVAQAEAEHRRAEDRLRRLLIREIVRTKVIKGYQSYIRLCEEAEAVARQIEADISAARARLTHEEQHERMALDTPYSLVAAAPMELQARFRAPGYFVPHRDVIAGLRAAFQLGDGEK